MTGVTKSSKQRAAELKARRAARSVKRAVRLEEDRRAFKIGADHPAGSVPVNANSLAPHCSYDRPGFAERGYYLDQPFQCLDCGKQEVWTATQQKWWYEIAKGGIWTDARRCRPCRRRERERAAEHKRVSDEGRERKARLRVRGRSGSD